MRRIYLSICFIMMIMLSCNVAMAAHLNCGGAWQLHKKFCEDIQKNSSVQNKPTFEVGDLINDEKSILIYHFDVHWKGENVANVVIKADEAGYVDSITIYGKNNTDTQVDGAAFVLVGLSQAVGMTDKEFSNLAHNMVTIPVKDIIWKYGEAWVNSIGQNIFHNIFIYSDGAFEHGILVR